MVIGNDAVTVLKGNGLVAKFSRGWERGCWSEEGSG